MRNLSVWVATAAMAVAACGGGDDKGVTPGPDPSGVTSGTGVGGSTGQGGASASDMGWSSGSRLRVRKYVGADGSEMPLGFVDMQTGEPCSPMRLGDGKLRCLPSVGSTLPYFGDPSCITSVAVFFSSTCGQVSAGDMVTQTIPSQNGCSNYTKLLQVGAPYSGPLYARSGVSCVSTTLPAGYDFYQVTELDTSGYVEMTEQVE